MENSTETESNPEKPMVRKEYVIDLNKIEDRLPTNWWNKIDPITFGFWTKLPLISYCRVKEYDILIQKQKREQDRFITIQYYQVLDGKASFMGMDNNRVKTFLSNTLFDYILKNKKLPFSCRFIKDFKNGNVQIDYTPTKWDKFAIHIESKEAKKHDIEDLMEFVHDLPSEQNNPAIKRKKTTPVQGVKRLSKEEYQAKMRKLEENELLSELKESDSEDSEVKPMTSEEMSQQIEKDLKSLESEPIKPIPISQTPQQPPKPTSSINPDQLVQFIKENDKGDGVSRNAMIEKFGGDIESLMGVIQLLCGNVRIYKVKPNFYSTY